MSSANGNESSKALNAMFGIGYVERREGKQQRVWLILKFRYQNQERNEGAYQKKKKMFEEMKLREETWEKNT